MYEYHITVAGDADRFVDWCHMNQVKPLFIDLTEIKGKGLQKQLQCTFRSCSHDDPRAQEYKDSLFSKGFEVLRVKCETHPESDILIERNDWPIYWEAHGYILTNEIIRLKALLPGWAKISFNRFSAQQGGKNKYWITVRHSDWQVVDLYLNALHIILSNNNFRVNEFKMEAVLIDTNKELDDGWV